MCVVVLRENAYKHNVLYMGTIKTDLFDKKQMPNLLAFNVFLFLKITLLILGFSHKIQKDLLQNLYLINTSSKSSESLIIFDSHAVLYYQFILVR